MMTFSRTIRHALGALYAWSVAVFVGAVLLDVVYASLLDGSNVSVTQSAFREVSDFLLLLGGLSILAGLAATAVSAHLRSASYLFAASLAVLLLEFLGPVVLFPLLRGSPGSSLPALGPILRLIPSTLASLLAFAALRVTFQAPRFISPS